MYLRALYLNQYRLYEEALFEFDPHINAIVGDNAVGKTTVLEAIHLLMTGSTFRQSQLEDMIRQGQSAFRIEAHFVKHGIEQKLAMYCEGKERRILYNSTLCASPSQLFGIIQGVTMHPDDVSLVKGAPGQRRQYLDLQLAQADPLYVHHLSRYYKAMRQRNALLKVKQTVSIESWEQEMALSAAYIVQQRYLATKQLDRKARALYHILSQEPADLSLSYKTSAPAVDQLEILRQYYQDLFTRYRRRELELGVTLNGPQKDDLSIQIGMQEVRFFASEGQQRSCVLAMKLAEWEHLEASCDATPLMLIDDVGMSLDEHRRKQLFTHLMGLKQVFLTATRDVQLPEAVGPSSILTLARS